jgi:hypothetical protein
LLLGTFIFTSMILAKFRRSNTDPTKPRRT